MLARLRDLFRRRQLDRELELELAHHVDALVAEHEARGMTPAAARLAAGRDMGGLMHVREAYRDQRGFPAIDELWRDVRYAGRALKRNPTYALTSVLILALGIGANAAIFSLINGLLLRRMPVSHPEQLVLIADPSRGGELPPGVPNQMPFMWSYRMWEEIRQRPELFQSTCGYFYSRFDLAAGGETEFADGLFVSGEFFQTLGVSTAVGRLLTRNDDRGDGASNRVAVIGHDFWQQRFGGAGDVVGRSMNVERMPFTIVGVLPPGFEGPGAGRDIDVAIPISAAQEMRGRQFFENAGVNWLTIMARLKPTQTIEIATTTLRGIQPQIRDASRPTGARGDSYLKNPLVLLAAERGNILDPLRVRAKRPLMTMQIAVGLVLLIACANIAGLMLARAFARRHEIGMRLALGASRLRIARQFFVESTLLVMMGIAGAIPVSEWGLRVLTRFFSTGTNTLAVNLAPDRRVLLFTTLTAIATAVLMSALPARHATRIDPITALKEPSANAAGTRFRLASGFVVVQLALSLVLVTIGGLLIRTYTNLAALDLGFDPTGLLIVDVGTQKAGIDPRRRLVVFENVRQTVAAVPGIAGAAVADLSPITGGAMVLDVEVRGGPRAASQETFVNRVSPGWLSLYKTSIPRGRDFDSTDGPRSLRVAIVNQAFVRRFLSGAQPLGQIIRQVNAPPGRAMEWTVVGVAVDAVYDSLRAAAPPTMYWAFNQIDDDQLAAGAAPESASLTIRAAVSDPRIVSRSVATAIASVNPDLDLTFRPLPALVSDALTIERSLALLSGLASGLSLLLAAIGLYGVMSNDIARRRLDIGIRMALGATRARVVREVLTRVLLLVAIGVVIGGAVAVWTSQFVSALIYGLKPRDPLTLVGASAILIVVATLAGWLPARRAARLDPMVALRE